MLMEQRDIAGKSYWSHWIRFPVIGNAIKMARGWCRMNGRTLRRRSALKVSVNCYMRPTRVGRFSGDATIGGA